MFSSFVERIASVYDRIECASDSVFSILICRLTISTFNLSILANLLLISSALMICQPTEKVTSDRTISDTATIQPGSRHRQAPCAIKWDRDSFSRYFQFYENIKFTIVCTFTQSLVFNLENSKISNFIYLDFFNLQVFICLDNYLSVN